MTTEEETLIYDAMREIQENSSILAALANRDGTHAAKEAYKNGVSGPCVKLQMLLSPEAMLSGGNRHDRIKAEAAAYCAAHKPK